MAPNLTKLANLGFIPALSDMRASKELINWHESSTDTYDASKPWNRQPFDSDLQWNAFREYLMLEIPRKIQTLAKKLDYQAGMLHSWKKKNFWVLRSQAFDNEVHESFQKCVATYIERTGEDYASRHIAMLTKAEELAMGELQKLLTTSREMPDITAISPASLIKLVEVTVKLGRLVHGESTENVQVENLDSFSVEELHTLKRLQKKAVEGQ